MKSVIKKIARSGIVPVISIDSASHAEALAGALAAGGIFCAEVTFRTDAAEESIRIMSEKFPEMIIGAGTVLTVEQAEQAIGAGAQFIVSPGFNYSVVEYCVQKNVAVIPGCATPSEIEQVIGLGLNVIKFFPSEALGGLKMLKALSAPYPHVKFMPTGGITEDNLNDYLQFDRIIACGGSWIADKEYIASGKFDKITELAGNAVTKMLGFKLSHIGINSANEIEAQNTANAFEKIFSFILNDCADSIFAGSGIEVLKSNGCGSKGHIAIETNFIERAVFYLESRGVKFDHATEKRNDLGRLKTIYLNGDFGGFAVHLIQKTP